MRSFRPIERLERSLETVIEGTFDRVFRPSIQPSKIGKRILRDMMDRRLASVSGPLVPNQFVVSLSPVDFASFEGGDAVIASHLESWLEDEISREGYATAGPVSISIESKADVRPRGFDIHSAFVDAPAGRSPAIAAQIDRTQAFAVEQPRLLQDAWVIEVSSGRLRSVSHWVGKRVTTVGRALDNNFVLDEPNVSRHHARLTVLDGFVQVEDLGSLNGTFVNGRPVHGYAMAAPGDTIVFGLVETLLWLASEPTYR
jgi:hypothetical protein